MKIFFLSILFLSLLVKSELHKIEPGIKNGHCGYYRSWGMAKPRKCSGG